MLIHEKDIFGDGKELADFYKDIFPMTETEGQKLIDYMDGHGYVLGRINEKLLRGDLCYKSDEIHWEDYGIENALYAVIDWNIDFLQEAEERISDYSEFNNDNDNKLYLEELHEDEQIFTNMFIRIKNEL